MKQEADRLKVGVRSLIFLAILTLFFILGVAFSPSAQAAVGAQVGDWQPDHQGIFTHTIYLPIVFAWRPPPPFGVEMGAITNSNGLPEAQAAGMTWVRRNGVRWDQVQPSGPGGYDWSVLSGLESEIVAAQNAGLTPILVVRGTPAWAQKIPGQTCGPIKQGNLDEFATFLKQLVNRYKDPPYSVKYWELGNEPDAPYVILGTRPFGCWGDPYDSVDYGGDYYALMLKYAYPAIKSADLEAQVLIGGLLYDWEDPWGQPMINFLHGVLRAGGGNYFDILSYHSYHFDGRWDAWGGGTVGKTNHLRQTMQAYGVDKPLIMSEGAYRTNDNPALFEAQANHLVKEYVRAYYLELWSYVWYGLKHNWEGSALINSDGSPRPAYDAYQTLTAQLDGCAYDHKMTPGETGYSDVEGHVFRSAQKKKKWVLWSTSDITRQVAFGAWTSPSGQFRRTDKYGVVTVVGDSDDGTLDGWVKISVNAPVYVEAVE